MASSSIRLMLSVMCVGLCVGSAIAEPWDEMDYGPFLSATVQVIGAPVNFAYKGIIVPLKEDRSVNVVFDTDLMRYAGGWTDGFISWTNIAHDGAHQSHNHTVGDVAFRSAMKPGWTRGASGDGADGRKLPFGPLPRDHAQWKGHYRLKDRVVLSYEVGGVAILDSPSLIEQGGRLAFVRTLHIAPHQQPMRCRIAEADDQVHTSLIAKPGEATLLKADAAWHLALPPRDQAVQVSVVIWRSDEKVEASPVSLDAASAINQQDLAAQISDKAAMPSRWGSPIRTAGKRGPERGPFATDVLTLPEDNAFDARVRPGGFDFYMSDPTRAAVCTWDGDVWIVSGIDEDLGELIWQRHATGLFQPLGLKIVDDMIYVLGRDQITRLHDLNADGEADYYEAFNHDAQVTEQFHEFAMDLQTDAQGNFYYMKAAGHANKAVTPQQGSLIRVSRDGQHTDIIAGKFRAPNGLCVVDDGTFITSDQQGHWTPANRINWIELDTEQFFGYNLGLTRDHPDRDSYTPPVCWIHNAFNRSPAAQIFVPDHRWKQLAGKMLSVSYGTGEIELVMHEKIGNIRQGGVVKLPITQAPTGVMRLRFHPRDGHLYSAGLFGWSSNRTKPGGFYRIRRTDKPLHSPVDLRVLSDGLSITFTSPLDREYAEDIESYAIQRWNYHWSENYGSPDLRVSDGTQGRDDVIVESAKLSDDGKTVRLKLADMQPAMQMHLRYDLATQADQTIRGEIYHTINVLPK